MVALPVTWVRKYFRSKLESFALEMDGLSLAIIGQITDHGQRFFQPEADNHYITRDLEAHPTCQQLEQFANEIILGAQASSLPQHAICVLKAIEKRSNGKLAEPL